VWCRNVLEANAARDATNDRWCRSHVRIQAVTGLLTAMMEITASGGAAGSVRHTTQRTLAPSRFQPVADDTHFLRPFITQLRPLAFAVVRTPSPGGRRGSIGTTSWFAGTETGSGARWFSERSEQPLALVWVPPSRSGNRPSTVPSIVSVTLGFTL